MNDPLTQLLSGKVKPGIYRFASHVSNEHLCAGVDKAGWLCYPVDGAKVSDKAAFLGAFAASLHFPSYFGHNWDAFEECLRDLSWDHAEDAKGILILYNDVDRFAKAHPKDWGMARDILKSVIAVWHKSSRPMIVLLRGDAAAAVDAPEL